MNQGKQDRAKLQKRNVHQSSCIFLPLSPSPSMHLFVLQLHTTPAVAREFGSFKQRALLALGKIVEEHGAKFAMPTQVLLFLISACSYFWPTFWQACLRYLSVKEDKHSIQQAILMARLWNLSMACADYPPLKCGWNGANAARQWYRKREGSPFDCSCNLRMTTNLDLSAS